MIDFRYCSAEDFLSTLADNSADLVLTDPPYFREIAEDWDRQWKSEAAFLEWLAGLASQWQRILRPNGSLYCFASPSMQRQVANVIAERFETLNLIRWDKPSSIQATMLSAPAQRRYSTSWEACIFAEQPGSDSTALGGSGYGSALDEARGMVFEPLRAYLAGERDRRGITQAEIVRKLGDTTGDHCFRPSQWNLPTSALYDRLRAIFGLGYLLRDWLDLKAEYDDLKAEYDDLKAEYDDLKAEYEHRRRPFTVEHGARNRSDLWTYSVPPSGPDRHPCEKPLDMLRDIITASTRPGAVVVDCFSGRASTACACVDTKRDFVGCERDADWHRKGSERIADHQLTPERAQLKTITGPLFGDME